MAHSKASDVKCRAEAAPAWRPLAARIAADSGLLQLPKAPSARQLTSLYKWCR
jgi:hypothetical protein